MMELLAISYSPWSEKARWALDFQGIEYRTREYIPMISEPKLRVRLKKWQGSVTVPILFADSDTIGDSLQIAEYADRVGGQPGQLFPKQHLDEILGWNESSERAMRAGRALISDRVLSSPEAKKEALPNMLRSAGSFASPVTNLAVGFFRRKYEIRGPLADQSELLCRCLSKLSDALESRDYLLASGFSYADIAMSTTLQFVMPVSDEFLRLGAATREAWKDAKLAEKFGHLVRWRDQLYEKHRLS